MRIFLSTLFACLFSASFAGAVSLRVSKYQIQEEVSKHLRDIPVNAFTYKQRLDHSNPFDRRTFSENYWVSPGYSVNENSPVIFYICGETACSPSDVKYMFPWAQTIGASVVVIEHRYYGTSQPFAQNTTENLKWMNMSQALADFAEIVTFLKVHNHMNGPWIVAGGSYSGMLSSSFRLTYPELVKGAWASSAPLNVLDDDQSYDLQMAKAMGEPCASSVRSVVALAEIAVQDPVQFAALRNRFGADTLTDPDDFLFSIADVAAAAVQYRLTDVLCSSFQTNDVISDYALFLAKMGKTYGYFPTSYSFAVATDTTAGGANSDLRTFFYQQCHEYGLFQTAYKDVKVSVRSQRLDINYMHKGCERLFGPSIHSNHSKISSTRERYFNPILYSQVSEIYFTNGSVDPWMPLGITLANGTWTNPHLYAGVIDASAHCDDLSFSRKDKTLALQEAAAEIELLLLKWTR